MQSQKLKENITNFTLLSPWILTFIIFWVYPIIYSFYLSFNEYNTLNTNDRVIKANTGKINYSRATSCRIKISLSKFH